MAFRHSLPHRPKGSAWGLLGAAAFALVTTVLATTLGGPTVSSAAPRATPPWVLADPGPATQFEKSTEERGVNPCNTADPGFGAYLPWASVAGGAYVLVPKNLPRGNTYDVVLHFHGREAARKEWAKAGKGIVVVGIDLGVGSGAYLDRYADPTELPRLLDRVTDHVRKTTGRAQLERRRLGLFSWSAGYGATLRILLTPWGQKHVDAVVLLDGLHTGFREGGLVTEKLEPFAQFAHRATQGEKMLFVSHSSIVPPGYASSTITSNYLVWRQNGRPKQVAAQIPLPMGLEQISFYQSGAFTVRGFSGNGKKDHCAHFGLLERLVIPALQRRWTRKG